MNLDKQIHENDADMGSGDDSWMGIRPILYSMTNVQSFNFWSEKAPDLKRKVEFVLHTKICQTIWSVFWMFVGRIP